MHVICNQPIEFNIESLFKKRVSGFSLGIMTWVVLTCQLEYMVLFVPLFIMRENIKSKKIGGINSNYLGVSMEKI